jgi:hypothetical protein
VNCPAVESEGFQFQTATACTEDLRPLTRLTLPPLAAAPVRQRNNMIPTVMPTLTAIIRQLLSEKAEMETRIKELGHYCLEHKLEESADIFKRLKNR